MKYRRLEWVRFFFFSRISFAQLHEAHAQKAIPTNELISLLYIPIFLSLLSTALSHFPIYLYTLSISAYQDLVIPCRLENQIGSLVLVFAVFMSMSEEVQLFFNAEYHAYELCLLKSHCRRDPCAGAQIRAGHLLYRLSSGMIPLTLNSFIILVCVMPI